MSLDLYFIFLAVAIVMMVTPGPAVVLAITNGLSHGVGGAVFAVFGNMAGLLVMSIVSVAGMGAVIATNPLLYQLLKLCGGAYLVYLGITMWRNNRQRLGVREQIESVKQLDRWQLFQRGLTVTASNPKAFVFVAALLPQFITLESPVLPQFSILLGTMLVLQMLVLNGYAMLASQIRPWLNVPGRLQILYRVIGTSFIAFGMSLALSEMF